METTTTVIGLCESVRVLVEKSSHRVTHTRSRDLQSSTAIINLLMDGLF